MLRLPQGLAFQFEEVVSLYKNQLFQRAGLLALTAVLALALAVPATAKALGGVGEPEAPAVPSFIKNGPLDGQITFASEDFSLSGDGDVTLQSIVIRELPDSAVGTLLVGQEVLSPGSQVEATALSGLRFQPVSDPTNVTAVFRFAPVFSDGTLGEDSSVKLCLLKAENGAPVAENLSITTYRDTAVTGYFNAMDPDGDPLTFQLTDKPARGSVTLAENSNTFLYTPYEGKSGKDSFSYVAIDSVGNISQPAKVSIKIQKPSTKVKYSDTGTSTASAAAVRLAEEHILVGECVGSEYFFRPDEPVSRSEFLTMTMALLGEKPLEDISVTGFADDASIPTWAKGYAASALRSGLVRGLPADGGGTVFSADAPITQAEAAVILDRAMEVTDVVTTGAFGGDDSVPAWAYQSAVNLKSTGILRTGTDGSLALNQSLTRGDAAEMLCAALNLLESR